MLLGQNTSLFYGFINQMFMTLARKWGGRFGPPKKEANVKKRLDKLIVCNFRCRPLSFIHVPFEVLKVIINDAFCD